MWTVLYIAPNQTMAEMIKDILGQEGFLVMLRSVGLGPAYLGAGSSFEVMVPESEAEEALEILAGFLGNERR